MDTPQSNALLKRLIAAVERVGHNLEILRQDLNRHSNTIRAAQERSKHQGDIKPIWLDPILAKYEQSEGNHHKKDDRQYGVQNSLRWGYVVYFWGCCHLRRDDVAHRSRQRERCSCRSMSHFP